MNTPSVFFSIIAIILYIYAIYVAVSNIRDKRNKEVRGLMIGILIIILVFGAFITIVALNSYGYLRVPFHNQVTRTMPDDYTPNTSLTKPPSAGSTQPSSQPAIDTHKEQMDKLKREGL